MSLLSFQSNIKNLFGIKPAVSTDISEDTPLIPNKSLQSKSSSIKYSYNLGVLNRIRSHTIPDLFLRFPFIKKNKISPRVIKKSNLFSEYLEDIKKDEVRFKNSLRIKHGQHQMWQGMLTTSLAQAEKRQHSRIRNFFFFKSRGNSNQRLATSYSVSAWSHDPSIENYDTKTFWQNLGYKIQSLLTFDTTKNLHLLSDGYKMRQGYLQAGSHAQKDILPSHLSTVHVSGIAKLLGGSDMVISGIAGIASIAGLVMDGRAQINVNVAQETFIDGMVSRLANSSTNIHKLEIEFKALTSKIQEMCSVLLRIYGELNSEELKSHPEIKKIEYLKRQLKDNFAVIMFKFLNLPQDVDTNGKLRNNNYRYTYRNINNAKRYLLQFFSEQELDNSRNELVKNNAKAEISDIIDNCVNKKIHLHSQNLKKQTESYQEHHRRHVDNFKEIFTAHFYQNQARVLGAAGVGVSFGCGVPVGAIISMLGKGALQLLTSSLDEAIRYNFRMSTFVKDGAYDFFHPEALNIGLGEIMRNSNPLEFEKKMASTIFSNDILSNYINDLDILQKELDNKIGNPIVSQNKNLITNLQIKIQNIINIINIRVNNKEIYYTNKSEFEKMIKTNILSENSDNIIWNKQDYNEYLLIQDKLNSNLQLKDKQKLENRSYLLLKKALDNNHILFNKLVNAKQELDSINRYIIPENDSNKPHKNAISYKNNKDLLDKLNINKEYIEFKYNALELCSKYLNIFMGLFKDNSQESLNQACKNIYGEKAWKKYHKDERDCHINKLREKLKYLSAINYKNTECSPLILKQILSKEKSQLDIDKKDNNNKLKKTKKYVEDIDKEIKNAQIKYSQIYLSITTPNLRKAENALAEASIKQDTIKNQLKARTTVREDQCDRVFNHRLSGLCRKVTNINLRISNYLISIGINPKSVDIHQMQHLCARNKTLNFLYKNLIDANSNFLELQKDISMIKKSIMFTKKEIHPQNNNQYISKDASGKYVTVYPEWENAHENVSKNNLWVKQIFTDNTYLNWHVGNIDTVKPGEFSGQLGYRFFHLPGRLAIPLVGLFSELAELAQTHSVDPVFSGITNAESANLFNSQLADMHNEVIQGRVFSHIFGGVSILSFILFGIWNLKYNKQYISEDPLVQQKISNLEKLIKISYSKMLKYQSNSNINNHDDIDFTKIKNGDKNEISKINQLTSYLQNNSSDDNNNNFFDIAFQGLSILKESQIKPKKDLNDSSIIPYNRLPEKMEIVEKQANGEEITFFNLNPAVTNHYAASQVGTIGKFARTRTTIKTLPKRAQQILPNALLGMFIEPAKILTTQNNYNKTKVSYKKDIPIIQNIIRQSSSIMIPKYSKA